MSYNMNDIERCTSEAISTSESKKARKFVESVDVIVNLKNVNLKDPNKRFNSEIELPHAVDPNPSLCFFVDGDQLNEANKVGVDALDKNKMDDFNKLEKAAKRNFVNRYDFFIASTEMMKNVAKVYGKVFGPKGKMPRPQPQGYGVINPGESIKPSIERYKNIIRVKLQKFPIIQFKIGDKSMETKVLSQNIKAALDYLEQKLERGRQNIRSIYIKTTMGTPVKLL
jgi:large subunit ribosomal protein L1